MNDAHSQSLPEFESFLRQALLCANTPDLPTLSELGAPAFSAAYLRWERRFLADPAALAARKLRPAWKKILQSVACLLLVFSLSLTIFAHAAPDAWAAAVSWVTEWYAENIVTRFHGAPADGPTGRWQPSYLPDGYVESSTENLGGYTIIRYLNGQGKKIELNYQPVQDGGLFNVDREDKIISPLSVNGFSGWLYISQIESKTNMLIWVDDQNNIAFLLIAQEAPEVLIAVAESIFLQK